MAEDKRIELSPLRGHGFQDRVCAMHAIFRGTYYRIRTYTISILSRTPLPIGLSRYGLLYQNRTGDVRFAGESLTIWRTVTGGSNRI